MQHPQVQTSTMKEKETKTPSQPPLNEAMEQKAMDLMFEPLIHSSFRIEECDLVPGSKHKANVNTQHIRCTRTHADPSQQQYIQLQMSLPTIQGKRFLKGCELDIIVFERNENYKIHQTTQFMKQSKKRFQNKLPHITLPQAIVVKEEFQWDANKGVFKLAFSSGGFNGIFYYWLTEQEKKDHLALIRKLQLLVNYIPHSLCITIRYSSPSSPDTTEAEQAKPLEEEQEDFIVSQE